MTDLPDALKSLTVKALRDLARKHVGEGYSRLKTKSQLVSAVAKSLDGAAAKALVAKVLGKKPEEKDAPRAPAKSPARPAPRPAKAPVSGKAANPTPARQATPTRPPPPSTPQIVPYDERLGELPDRYQDDAFVALAVDPETLFLYWDHAPDTVRTAAEGLPSPRAVLSLHAGGQKVREIDFALESRCFYLRGLSPAKSYHAEIDFVGSDGRRRRVGHPSNSVDLPPLGPSEIVDDRFISFPWALEHGWHLRGRPVPGTAQRDLAGGGARGGASAPFRPWNPGGSLSGRPLGK